MKITIPFIILLVTVLAGCGGGRYHTHFDRNISFDQFQQYAWIPTSQFAGPIRTKLKSAVEAALKQKGFQQTGLDDADLHLRYQAMIDENGAAGMATEMFRAGDAFVNEYQDGTLILEMINPENGQLIWKSSIIGAVNKKLSPEKKLIAVEDAVEKLFSSFPPEEIQ